MAENGRRPAVTVLLDEIRAHDEALRDLVAVEASESATPSAGQERRY